MEHKKQIGILTFHNACNYGAFLQAKALFEILNSYSGIEAFIIDYRNENVTSDYSCSGIFKSSSNPKTVFLKLLRVKDIIKRNKIFSKFQENTFHYIPFDDKECKCQYKNDQKVENKNVHFPRSIPQFVFP